MKGARQGKTSPLLAAGRMTSTASPRFAHQRVNAAPACSSSRPPPARGHSPAQRSALAQALAVAPVVLTSVLSETEGSRPPPTPSSGHPGRHNVATEAAGGRAVSAEPTQPTDTQPRTFNEQMRRMTRLRPLGRSTAPAYAACDITSPASKLPPLFHTAKVTAAILRVALRKLM